MVTRRALFFSTAGMASLSRAQWAQPAEPVPATRPALTPPMGWNSFDSYGTFLHEKAARANIDAMAKKLAPFGYVYFVIDNGWFAEYELIPGTIYSAQKHAADLRIDEYGLYQPSKTYFPQGLKPLIDHAHGMGLKFGIHIMRGIPRKSVELNLPIRGTKYTARDAANPRSTCSWCPYNYGVDMSKPAGQAFYNSWIGQLAGWGVDFIKADDLVPYPEEILGIADAIAQSGRDMVLSLSPGNGVKKTDLPYYRRGNLLRLTADIWDRASDLDKGFQAWRDFQGSEFPGFWPDLDMIPFGQLQLMSPVEVEQRGVRLTGYGHRRWCALTRDEMRTFITQRAMAASPLMVGGDLPTLDDFSLSLLTNREMLACNQNGVMGCPVWQQGEVEAWRTSRKDRPGEGWLGIFNRGQATQKVSMGPVQLGLDEAAGYDLQDIWGGGPPLRLAAARDFDVPAGGVVFLRFNRKL